MVEQKKKKKLTLSVSSTKTFSAQNYSNYGKKKSVVIEKKSPRNRNDRRLYRKNDNFNKPNEYSGKAKQKFSGQFNQGKTPENKNFEIRKQAEERATKRFKKLKDENLLSKKPFEGSIKTYLISFNSSKPYSPLYSDISFL